MPVRLKPAKTFRYETARSHFKYVATYDYASGRKNVYWVIILTEGAPLVIGREIPLKAVRPLIREYEKTARIMDVWGRKGALRVFRTHVALSQSSED